MLLLNPYQVKEVRFPSGERMPLLVQRQTGMALEAPSYWITSERRPLGVQAATLQQELRHIAMLYLWADARGVDLLGRLRSPAFLKLDQLNDLDRFCRKQVQDAVFECFKATRSAGNVVSWAKKGSGSIPHFKPAGRGQVRNRMASIHSFMDHISCDHLSRLVPGTEAYNIYSSCRAEMLKIWQGRFKSLNLPASLDARLGLDAAALEKLREVIRQDNAKSPWTLSVRARNALIVLLLWSLGIRRGELCALRTSDLLLTATGAILRIVRRPSDPLDERSSKPGVKTLGRDLIIKPELALLIQSYIMTDRRKHPSARRHPFLFVSSQSGAPLSLSSLNKLFQVLRRAQGLPADFSPHVLRHTWNDAFYEASVRASPRRTSSEVTNDERMHAYLQGWVPGSKSPATYTRRSIRAAAGERSLALQGKIRHVGDLVDGSKG